jgi:hypothetical protein
MLSTLRREAGAEASAALLGRGLLSARIADLTYLPQTYSDSLYGWMAVADDVSTLLRTAGML